MRTLPLQVATSTSIYTIECRTELSVEGSCKALGLHHGSDCRCASFPNNSSEHEQTDMSLIGSPEDPITITIRVLLWLRCLLRQGRPFRERGRSLMVN
jgi:hypothetical protein